MNTQFSMVTFSLCSCMVSPIITKAVVAQCDTQTNREKKNKQNKKLISNLVKIQYMSWALSGYSIWLGYLLHLSQTPMHVLYTSFSHSDLKMLSVKSWSTLFEEFFHNLMSIFVCILFCVILTLVCSFNCYQECSLSIVVPWKL